MEKDKWVKKEIEVIFPEDAQGSYEQIFIYLAKVVDSFDPRYGYIIGLLNTLLNRGKFSKKQEKMALDIMSYFFNKGYFKGGENE